jgi:hypothetical protein
MVPDGYFHLVIAQATGVVGVDQVGVVGHRTASRLVAVQSPR